PPRPALRSGRSHWCARPCRGTDSWPAVMVHRGAGTPKSLASVMKQVPGRVLVVDDEPLVCGLLRDFLATVSDEVATATSGTEALRIVRGFQPDVILTDMMMPGMSGA